MAATHTLNVTRGGLILLQQTLARTEWYEGKPMYIPIKAADVLEELADPAKYDLKVPTDAKTNADIEEWAGLPMSFECTEKQREAIKVNVQFCLTKAILSPSKHVKALAEQVGLVED